MASSRNSKEKSSGLRILWIPGKRKSHPKGRYDSTNKQVSYNTAQQKKNQSWSLGGSKSHKQFIEAEPDTSLLDGPSVSGLSPLAACTVTAAAAANNLGTNQADGKAIVTDAPSTPNSSSSTALLVSIPNSPEPVLTAENLVIHTTNNHNEIDIDATETATSNMPAAKLNSHPQAQPQVTTVAEIIKENRFAVFDQNNVDNIDAYDLPTPPKDDPHWRNNLHINTSGDTTNSIATMSSTSPNSDGKSSTSSPVKKKLPRNHNNNQQGDVNSIESLSESDQIPKLQNLEWVDELVLEHQANQLLRKTSKHKKKKQHSVNEKLEVFNQLDELDAVTSKTKLAKVELEREKDKQKDKDADKDNDDKLVKCLYFTLMCCECSIS